MRDEAGKNMSERIRTDLKIRTKDFALCVVRLYSALPKSVEAQVLGKQCLRSGTSVGAHYHEARRAKSDADFINKMEGALQELDETAYWLELLEDSKIVSAPLLQTLKKETDELISIFVTIVRKVKSNGTRKE